MTIRCGADVVILGASVITMDRARPRTEAIAVKFNRVVAVGGTEEIRALAEANTQVIDARGLTVVPGFIDAHCHPLDAGRRSLLRADLGPDRVASVADAKRILGEFVRERPVGTWTCAFGYDEAKVSDGRLLTRADLDEVTTEHPVFVEHSSGHIGMLNTAGLRAAALTRSSDDPAGGSLGRDEAGELDGRVYETGQDRFIGRGEYRGRPLIPAPTQDEDRRALAHACREAGRLGITGWHEMLSDPCILRTFQSARREQALTARVTAYIYVDYLQDVLAAGLMSGFGDDMVRLGGIKLLGDGALSGRTAYLNEPYEGTENDFGVIGVTQEAMEAQVLEAHRNGLQIGVHANGDRFISMVMDAYEKALVQHPRANHRHRIEHCSVMTEHLLTRMKRLGLVGIPFGEYIYYHGEKMHSYGAQRLGTLLPHRSFLDMEIPIGGSSDYPCGPWNPMIAIQSCTTRKTRDGRSIGAGQRITPEEAIRVYTLGSAYASFDEHERGSIEPGKLADVVMLSDDPTTCDPESIASIEVRMTMVGGKMVYRAW